MSLLHSPASRPVAIGLVLLAVSVLLFSRLGHYALWDDEAATALAAKGVLQTGDTSMLMEHGNICAYRGGLDIVDFCDHAMPPLDAYLTALSFKLFGIDAWAARLPFALLGVATVALILYWARGESWPVFLVLTAGLLGNVSLILFFRQCRYYGPSIFFTLAIVFVYWRWKPTPRNLVILAMLSVLLFVSNYVSYVMLYACLAVDYAIWKRKEYPPSLRKGLLLFGPQLILNALVSCVWNPFMTSHGAYLAMNSFADRLTLFYWYWRDMDRSEYFSLPVVLVALWVGLKYNRPWMVRGCVAMAVYVVVLSIISPQRAELYADGEVRYLPALIPLGIALETGALCALWERRKVLLAIATVVVFGTNFLNGAWLCDCGMRPTFVNPATGQHLLDNGIRVTLLSYIEELISPPPEPYTPVAQWINDHVPEGDSVWVQPDYSTYPLMFHAPRALYAWQLDWPPRPDFASLPRIHFLGQEPPDYLIAFGPYLKEIPEAIHNLNRSDVSYKQVATINVFWRDLYRPELIWRTFQPITNFDPAKQAVYIFQRVNPPISTH